MKQKEIALIWTGGGFGGCLPGIPGRDLTAAEVKEHGGESNLIGSGLYEKPKAAKAKKEGE